jgi:ketol-acid reductoisomerase
VSASGDAATVAVIGFGNQGAAQALQLRRAGVDVIVGARAGGGGESRSRAAGFSTVPLEQAAARGSMAAILLPDEVVPEVWPELERSFARGCTLIFAHGFNLLDHQLAFPPTSDVILVSPAGPGRVLAKSDEGSRLAAYIAVHRDASGRAWLSAETYAGWLGCSPVWRTTVREETEVDLFGEQVVLCGGMNALVLAAFETLVSRGYAPEMAYLECVHQLRYLAELLNEQGPSGFRRSISGTALFGDLTRGPRVVGPESRREMSAILDEIRSGAFAREWRAEVAGGRRRLEEGLRRAAEHPIEEARRRALGTTDGRGDTR